MNIQHTAPQNQEPKSSRNLWKIVSTGIITFLAILWRFIFWIWSILIIGIVIGILGNATFTILTTGKISLTGTLMVVTWLYVHLRLLIIISTTTLIITFGSYFVHHQKQRITQKSQPAYNESLAVIASRVQQALDELNTLSPVSHDLPSPSVSESENNSIPQAIWNVPYRRNPFFTGREALLQLLHDYLTQATTAAITQPPAITGLGGIGKTQIAIEYAHRHHNEYNYVLWVNAATPITLIQGFVQIARLLQLPLKEGQDQNIVVEDVKQWLANHDRWFLILDNADDLNLAHEFLPTTGKGHILLTTRDSATGSIANFDVEKMDKQESMELLLRRAKILASRAPLSQTSEADQVTASAIVDEMDGLPLAIDQAGAYIEETQCSLPAYLNAFQQRRSEFLRLRGRASKEHPDAVAATWSLNFEQVEQLNPTAADLLRACAFLAPDAIPIEMIVTGASQLGPFIQPIAIDPTLLDKSLSVLLHYSLVRRNKDDNTLSIHRLVQAMVKITMDDANQHEWAERIVQAVNQAFPDVIDIDTWPQCKRYLPHAQACAELVKQYSLVFSEAGRLLNLAGYYLYTHALYVEAEPLLKQSLDIIEEGLGPMHPDTANSLNSLAFLYRSQGKYEQAIPLHQRALAIWEEALGPTHPDTATCLNNLAIVYHAQGKYKQAETLLKRTLAIREETLEPANHATAIALNDLAMLYQSQGKYEQAEPLAKRALAIWEEVLGPMHPNTATGLNTLAMVYQSQGKYEQAESLHQRALSIWEEVLGPMHPNITASLNNLAILYQSQGKYEQAEPLLKRAVAILEEVLGPMHPDTAIGLNNLAILYRIQGEYEQAEPLLKRALSIREEMLGPIHPNTAISLNNLASFYWN